MGFFDFLFTSITWNTAFEADPAGGDSPSFGDNEIRDLKQAVRERVIKEHTMNTASGILTSDGYHRAGSAKTYYQATAPTLRPDGVTELTADDNGRRWVRSSDYREYVYVHPTWTVVTALVGADNTFSGDNTFTGDNTFSGSNIFSGNDTISGNPTFSGEPEFTGQVTGAVNVDSTSSVYPGEKIKTRFYSIAIGDGGASGTVAHGIANANTNERIINVRAIYKDGINSYGGEGSTDPFLMIRYRFTDTDLIIQRNGTSGAYTVKVMVQYI